MRIMPSITALQCFEASARHLSFTSAAQELSLTQSAVSKQVAQLEETLCHSLFQRVKKRLHLTPAGELYLLEVKKILTQIDISSRYILTYGGATEVLTISSQPTFGAEWLVPRLAGFNEAYPNIHLNIRSDLEPFDLVSSQSDIAFFFGHGSWPGATCIALFEEYAIPVCRKDWVEKYNIKSAESLTKLDLLQCSSRPEAWRDWFSNQGIQTDKSFHGPRFDTFYMCQKAAIAGCGIALLPKYLVDAALLEGKLVIPVNSPIKTDGTHYLAHKIASETQPKVAKFINWISSRI